MVRGLSLAGCFLVFEGGVTASGAQACNSAGIVVSSFAVAGLAVFDIATAPASVRRYNERPVAVAPYLNGRDRSYGVSVSMAFGRSPRAVTLPARVPVARDSVRPRKSPGTGFALSFLSTAVPMAAGVGLERAGTGPAAVVFLSGVVVGPSVGHFYAGRVGRGLGTAMLRGAGTGLFIASIAGCFDD
jgi:hypothetical protein